MNLHHLFLQLMGTGVFLFALTYFGIHVEPPYRHRSWYEALVGCVFIAGFLLFFIGGFGAVWTFR